MIRLLSARCASLIVFFSCAVPSQAEQPDRIVPVKVPRPAISEPSTAAQPETEAVAPEDLDVPLPKSRPEHASLGNASQQPSGTEALPAREVACREQLAAMGVRFTPADPVQGKDGCGIDHPIRVTGLPFGVKLSGRAIMGCDVSESLAKWTIEVAIPQARKQFGQRLAEIEQYASYACRTRNSQKGRQLSEHAKGNAIDLGRFRLADGTVIDVASRAEEETQEKRFLKALRDGGCSHFKTVLGPGSDPYHDTHFHFDVAKRRNGSRYCR